MSAVAERPAGLRVEEAHLAHLFARQAAARATAVAVSCPGEGSLTYGDLNRRANQLAHALRARGVGPESLVGLFLDRSLDLVVAILGVLKAGGAYVPMDLAYPKERRAYICADAGLRTVITHRALLPELPDGAGTSPLCLDDPLDGPTSDPPLAAGPDHLAYVIYTSGSTGRPKGVRVTHANVLRLFSATAAWFGFGSADVWTLFHSVAFDFSVWELWGALLYGGRLVVVPYVTSRSPAAFRDLLAREKVTVLNQTPSAFRQLIQADAEAGSTGSAALALRWVVFGGEALEIQSLRPWWERHGDERPRLVNMYGITETTVHVTYRPIGTADLASPRRVIGVPIPDLEVYVLDPAQQVAEEGEICVGGAGLARGYLNRPELEAERFIPHPFAAQPGARLYRSGDLARRLPDGGGDLEYLGRLDHQVKIRGFRIEIGEIESVLAAHPEVAECAVLLREVAADDQRLTAYVVPPADRAAHRAADCAAGGGANGAAWLAALRSFARERLPEYMVPAAWVVLDRLPLTDHGKVDRRALPAPAGLGAGGGSRPPQTPLEVELAGLWSQILGVAEVGAEDSFFDLGGHSILAARLIARIRDAHGVQIPLATLFSSPTVEQLARTIAELAADVAAGPPAVPPLVALPREGQLPVSFAQERLWLSEQMNPGSNAFNIGYALHLAGPLAVPALAAGLGQILERHEALRTRIVFAGQPVQVVEPPPAHPLPRVDLAALPGPARQTAARQAAVEVQQRPFDLARGPLLRAALLRLAADDHVLCLAVHHIVFDGWSLGVFIAEVQACYQAFPAPALASLPVQYADYAVWQRGWLQGELLAERAAFWRALLAGDRAPAILPTDRPAARAGGRLEEVRFTVEPELLDPLLRLGHAGDATLFMVLLAALDLLLHRYTGSPRTVVGTMHANRAHTAIEDLIGFFVNVLPLPAAVEPGWTFRELLSRVRATALEVDAHADTPYERILEEVRPGGAADRNALFQVMFILQSMPLPALRLAGLEVSPFEPGKAAKQAPLDLTLTLVPAPVSERGRLLGWVEYDSGLFDRATAERFARHYQQILRDVARDAGQRIADLPVVDEDGDGDGEKRLPDGRLWLTDGAVEDDEPPVAVHDPLAAAEKSAVLLDQVAARRSKLSDKQRALLQQRLRK